MEENKNEEQKEGKNSMFGLPKRERDNRTALILYLAGAAYLIYTSVQMIREWKNGEVTGSWAKFYIAAPILFLVASVWILWMAYRVWKISKAEDAAKAEQAKKEAEAKGEEYVPEASFLDKAKAFAAAPAPENPDAPKKDSIAARAAAYVNFAEDEPLEDETGEEKAAEEKPAETEEAGEEAENDQ